VFKQDFDDYQLVVVDDCSSDDTPELMTEMAERDSRIRYLRLEKNIGSKFGDREIFRQFVANWADGEHIIYLCDDDYWIPSDLLSRSVKVMDEHPSVVQVMGAQVQIYPNIIHDIPNINDYWHYEETPGIQNGLAMMQIFPNGLIARDDFLELQSQDPIMRNILTGASLFRRSAFQRAGVLAEKKGSQWQAGYELTTGIATQGDSYYFDTPSIAAQVDMKSASFRGTQKTHLVDCLKSVSIAFHKPKKDASPDEQNILRHFENKIKHAIIFTYVRNKIGFHLGWFGSELLPELKKILLPQISGLRFWLLARKHGFPLSPENRRFLWMTCVPGKGVRFLVEKEIKKYGYMEWHKIMSKWPMP
jgi:glycosyltransferase involved in cell wall biosynthesis